MALRNKRHTRKSVSSRPRKSSPLMWRRWFIVILPIVILIAAITVIRRSPSTQTVLGVTTSAFREEIVKWNSVPNATGYNIYYKEKSDKDYTNAVRNLSVSTTSYTINFLKKNVDYQYYITAYDSSEKEFWSSAKKWIWAENSSQ